MAYIFKAVFIIWRVFRCREEDGDYTSEKNLVYLKIPSNIDGYDIKCIELKETEYEIETLEFSEGIEEIEIGEELKVKNIKFPKSVKYIFSFGNLEKLETIEFQEGVEMIHGFNNCSSLESVKFPKSLKSIVGFSDCRKLKNIEISEGVESIGYDHTFRRSNWNRTFIGCESLTELVIPSTVKEFNVCMDYHETEMYRKKMYTAKNIYFLGEDTNLNLYWIYWPDGNGYSVPEYEKIYPPVKDISEFYNSFSNASIMPYLGKPNIYCYEDSIVANLKNDFPDYFNVQYITSDTKIPTIPEQKPNNPTTTTTKYTTLPLTTINNQLYVKGINPESNTVEQIIKSGEFAEGTTVKVYKYGQEIANSEKVGTGSVIKVLENGEVKEEYIVVVYGDTDGDGEITSIDALAIVKNKTGKIPFTTEAQKEAARLLTKTGTSGAVDALAIVKSRTGKAVINQENGTVSKK